VSRKRSMVIVFRSRTFWLFAGCAAVTCVLLGVLTGEPPAHRGVQPHTEVRPAPGAIPEAWIKADAEHANDHEEGDSGGDGTDGQLQRRVSLRAVDPEGSPVGGSTVSYLQDHGPPRPLGRTDGSGRARVEIPSTAEDGGGLLVWRKGFVPSFAPLGEFGDGESEATIVLSPAGKLTGFVTHAGGAPADNARVLAWGPGRRPSLSLLRRVLSGERDDPRLLLVETDARGAFVLTGVDPSRTYRLAAGKSGAAAAAVTGRPNHEPVRLVLKRVFGCFVHLAGPKGATPEVSPRLWATPYWSWKAPGTVDLFSGPGDRALALAGVSSRLRAGRRQGWFLPLMFTAKKSNRRSLNVRAYFSIPAFRAIRVSRRWSQRDLGRTCRFTR